MALFQAGGPGGRDSLGHRGSVGGDHGGAQRLAAGHQPAQLGDRLGVVVDAHVADHVLPRHAARLAGDDEHPARPPGRASRRPPPAPPRAPSRAGRPACRPRSGTPRAWPATPRLGHHVRLAGDARAMDVPGLGDARRAGVGGAVPDAATTPTWRYGGHAVAPRGAAQRLRRRSQPVRSASRHSGPYAGSVNDCVTTAPTPASTQSVPTPAQNAADWIAAPSSPVSGVPGDDRVGHTRQSATSRPHAAAGSPSAPASRPGRCWEAMKSAAPTHDQGRAEAEPERVAVVLDHEAGEREEPQHLDREAALGDRHRRRPELGAGVVLEVRRERHVDELGRARRSPRARSRARPGRAGRRRPRAPPPRRATPPPPTPSAAPARRSGLRATRSRPRPAGRRPARRRGAHPTRRGPGTAAPRRTTSS